MRVLRHAGTAAYGDLRFTTAMRLPLVAGGGSTTLGQGLRRQAGERLARS